VNHNVHYVTISPHGNNGWDILVLKFRIRFCGTIPKVLNPRGLKLNCSKNGCLSFRSHAKIVFLLKPKSSSEIRSIKPRLWPQGIRRTDHATPLYPQELAPTSPTSGGRSVGIDPEIYRELQVYRPLSLLLKDWEGQVYMAVGAVPHFLPGYRSIR
jgi:hypothetical protein